MTDVMDSVLNMLQNATNEMGRLEAENAHLRAENERLRDVLKAVDRHNDDPARYNRAIDQVLQAAFKENSDEWP